MKGKQTHAFALGFVVSCFVILAGCATAPSQKLSILEVVDTGSLRPPQSCAERNAATVCVKTMRLNRVKDCSCMDRRLFTDGSIAPF